MAGEDDDEECGGDQQDDCHDQHGGLSALHFSTNFIWQCVTSAELSVKAYYYYCSLIDSSD
ncbi:hypothetical protein TYRP_002811 [Tyrophagus putrescentiae]|nr:hypothetical protein TYRP_002811 [Tyrophagus putrescentiae]